MIVGCIYCYPHMTLNEFNVYFVNNLLVKLSKENNFGDFNIDLLNYNQHSPTNEFLDSLLPYAPASYCATNMNKK